MNKIIHFLFIVLFLGSCKNTSVPEYAIIKGAIENPESDSLNILALDMTVLSSIKLSENNEFIDTIQKPDGYYYLTHGKRLAQIYLLPNSKVELTFDGKSVNKPISYEGNGAIENNYLAKKAAFQQNLFSKSSPGHYLKLNEQSFLKLKDSVTELNNKFFENFVNLDENFAFLEKQAIDLDEAEALNVYRNMSKQNPNLNLSEDYPEPFDKIQFNDERLLKIPNFIYSAEAYYQDKNYEKWMENKASDFYTSMLETIDIEVENRNLREELAFNTGLNRMLYSQTLEDFYEKYMGIATNEEYRTKVTKKYNLLKKVAKGEVSQNFELYSINNKMISLSDLRGKPVYIDLWATWCMPCIAEIPALKELEKRFEEIQFVSICKSDTKEKWTKMVAEKELQGIQLFAPKDDIEFFEAYMVEGIPRFILLDKDGKIVDSNAKRPSDPSLIGELESL